MVTLKGEDTCQKHTEPRYGTQQSKRKLDSDQLSKHEEIACHKKIPYLQTKKTGIRRDKQNNVAKYCNKSLTDQVCLNKGHHGSSQIFVGHTQKLWACHLDPQTKHL